MNFSFELENMLKTTLNAIPPLLFAGLGGMITSKIGVLNLGLEGMMLIGAFVAVIVNHFTLTPMLGLLAALIICSLIGLFFGVFNVRFKVNNIVMSVGINMFAVSITKYLSGLFFGSSGAITSDRIQKLPTLPLPFLEQIPVLKVFSGLSIVFWLAIIITFALSYIINKTTWGLHIRGVGFNDLAVESAGINTKKVKYICIMLSGSFCGLAGAYLSTSYLSMFTNGMTAGRGFLGNIASIIGNRTAFGTFLGSLLFSLIDGITMKIQTFGFSSQLIQLIPYAIALMILIVGGFIRKYNKQKKAHH